MNLLGLLLFWALALVPPSGQIIQAVEVYQEVAIYFPAETRQEAVCIAYFESGFDPKAVGDNGRAIGLFQIRTDAHPEYDRARLFEADYNTKAAAEIRRASGETFRKDWVIAASRCGAR